MVKFCLVCLVHNNTSKGPDVASVIVQALQKANIDVEVVRLPYFFISALTTERLRGLKRLLKDKSQDRFVVFSPDTTELFLTEPNFTIMFSAYRSWYDENIMEVIPHLWTPVRMPSTIDHLLWTAKPDLRIGFMGSTHATSRVANLLLKFPAWTKTWFLGGRYLQFLRMIALMCDVGISIQHINTFPRTEVIAMLRAKQIQHNASLDIVERYRFGGSAAELNEYIEHLQRNTYIICPRGSENYSFRIYETLSMGRIPVIIDTDVVLPRQVSWEELCVFVPYGSLDRIYEIILHDYQARSNHEFVLRQQKAFSVMADLHSMHWADDLSDKLIAIASGARRAG